MSVEYLKNEFVYITDHRNYSIPSVTRVIDNITKLKKVYAGIFVFVFCIVLLFDVVAFLGVSCIAGMWFVAYMTHNIQASIHVFGVELKRPEKLAILSFATLFIVTISFLIWYVFLAAILSSFLIGFHASSYHETTRIHRQLHHQNPEV